MEHLASLRALSGVGALSRDYSTLKNMVTVVWILTALKIKQLLLKSSAMMFSKVTWVKQQSSLKCNRTLHVTFLNNCIDLLQPIAMSKCQQAFQGQS